MSPASALRLPRCEPARDWLARTGPLPSGPPPEVLHRQHDDGSWGPADDPGRRVLPTLWTAATLGELGAATDPAWHAAVDFLSLHAATDDGVFSRDGRTSGVLACYVAIAASTYLRGGRRDLAAPQVEWILRYQDVRTAGCSRRGGVAVYRPGLATRYGGCLAATSCLVGVVKAGRALELWRRAAPGGTASSGTARSGTAVEELLAHIRESLLERRLMFASSGSVLPLGTPPARAREWLAPSFPLDWRTDLVEVTDLVARTGPPDERMQPALDHLAAVQLTGGAWPLLRGFWPLGFPAVEPRSVRSPSRLATRRVLDALTPLVATDGGTPVAGQVTSSANATTLSS